MSVNPSMGPRVIYPNFSKMINVASGAASTTASSLVAGVTGWTIYITGIHHSVHASGATTFRIEDSTGSVVFQAACSTASTFTDRDYGQDGFAMAEGMGIQYDFTTAATAAACRCLVEGYMRPTSPVSAAAYAAAVLP